MSGYIINPILRSSRDFLSYLFERFNFLVLSLISLAIVLGLFGYYVWRTRYPNNIKLWMYLLIALIIILLIASLVFLFWIIPRGKFRKYDKNRNYPLVCASKNDDNDENSISSVSKITKINDGNKTYDFVFSNDIKGYHNTCFYRALAKEYYGNQNEWEKVHALIFGWAKKNSGNLGLFGVDSDKSIDYYHQFVEMYSKGNMAEIELAAIFSIVINKPIVIIAPYYNEGKKIEAFHIFKEGGDMVHKVCLLNTKLEGKEAFELIKDIKTLKLVLRNNHFETFKINESRNKLNELYMDTLKYFEDNLPLVDEQYSFVIDEFNTEASRTDKTIESIDENIKYFAKIKFLARLIQTTPGLRLPNGFKKELINIMKQRNYIGYSRQSLWNIDLTKEQYEKYYRVVYDKLMEKDEPYVSDLTSERLSQMNSRTSSNISRLGSSRPTLSGISSSQNTRRSSTAALTNNTSSRLTSRRASAVSTGLSAIPSNLTSRRPSMASQVPTATTISRSSN